MYGTPISEIDNACQDIEALAEQVMQQLRGDLLTEFSDERGDQYIPVEQWPEPWAALWAMQQAMAAAKRAREHLAKLIKAERDYMDDLEALADANSY